MVRERLLEHLTPSSFTAETEDDDDGLMIFVVT